MHLAFLITLLSGLLVVAVEASDWPFMVYFDVDWRMSHNKMNTTPEIQDETGILEYHIRRAEKPYIFKWALHLRMKKMCCRTLLGQLYTFTDSGAPPKEHHLTCHIFTDYVKEFDSTDPSIQRVGIQRWKKSKYLQGCV